MTHKRKRIMSFVVMLILLVSLVPVTAMAADAQEPDGSITEMIGESVQTAAVTNDEPIAVDLNPGDYIDRDLYDTDFSTYEYVRGELAQALQLRKEEIYLYMKSDTELTEGNLDLLMLEGTAMLIDTYGGDYLMCSVVDYGYYAEYILDGNTYYYIIGYAVVYSTTAEQEAELESRVQELQDEVLGDAVNEYQKIKAIYDYIINNVEYDFENAANTEDFLPHTAYAALMQGKATMQGYCMLFDLMTRKYGITSNIIIGTVEGMTFMWNIVRCDDVWYNMNIVADKLDGSYAYFMRGSTDFPDGHTPADVYLTELYMQGHPLAETAYVPEMAKSGSAGADVTWYYNALTNEIHLTGSGRMDDDVEIPNFYGGNPGLVVEEGITYIGKNAFNSISVNTAQLPDSLTEIGDYAFSYSTLSAVSGGENLSVIGEKAFSGCYNLTDYTLPASVTKIGASAFYEVPITQANIPANVNEIGAKAFENDLFEGYIVDDNNPNFSSESGVLYNKDKTVLLDTPKVMTAEFNMPETVTTIAEGAFSQRGWLNGLRLHEGVTEIGKNAFRNAGLVVVQLPSTLTEIPEGAFSTWTLTSITIPATLTAVGSDAFSECSQLSDIHYGGTVDQWNRIDIGDGNFYLSNATVHENSNKISGYNWSLDLTTGAFTATYFSGAPWKMWKDQIVSVELHDNATDIPVNAFKDAVNLQSLSIYTDYSFFGEGAFAGCTGLIDVYYDDVEAEWVENGYAQYFPDSPDMVVRFQEALLSGTLGLNLEWTFDRTTDTLTISGEGPMIDFREGEARPWDECLEEGGYYNLVLEEGVSSVGDNAFYFEYARGLNVTFASTIESIGDQAFRNCQMGFLVFNEGLKTIGDAAFHNCGIYSEYNGTTGLWDKILIFPEGLEYIDHSAFWGVNPTVVYVPDSVQFIGSYAFQEYYLQLYYGGSAEQWQQVDVYDSNDDNVKTPAYFNAGCPHLPKLVDGRAATCTESGLTEGKACVVCGVFTIEQEVIPANGHRFFDRTCADCGMVLDPSLPLDGSIDGVTWVYDVTNGILVISGEGAIPDYAAAGDVPWSIWSGDVVSVTMGVGITAVGDNAFAGFEKLSAVSYEGTMWKWQQLEVGSGNEALTDAELATAEAFNDVLTTDWFYGPVNWAVATNVTGGIGNGQFGPNNFCTRAQVVTFLWAAAGKPEPTTTDNPFEDVADDAWYVKPVLWAVENGITGGTSPTTFGPDNYCTRAQVVTFLYAAAGKPEITASSTFDDVADTDWFAKPVIWAKENDVTGGISATEFGPNQTCTRAQVVTFLYKVYGAN